MGAYKYYAVAQLDIKVGVRLKSFPCQFSDNPGSPTFCIVCRLFKTQCSALEHSCMGPGSVEEPLRDLG